MNSIIITVSDRSSKNQREDITGKNLQLFLENNNIKVEKKDIIPDEKHIIIEKLKEYSKRDINFIITNGGTGLSKRDVTPEATETVIERRIPGVSEIIRMHFFTKHKTSILSRGICGVLNNSIILNLPGNPKGAVESLELVIGALKHAVEIISGRHCKFGEKYNKKERN